MAIKVFLDTNIYENANFSFCNKQFTKLKDLNTDEKDLSVSVEVDDINANTNMYLHENDIIESEIVHNTMDDYDEEPFDGDANYCPDCGCKMDYNNDMGAFCSKCAPDH